MSTKYIHFTEAQKAAARQVDLAGFLQSCGEALKRSGSEVEWVGHHITLRGNQYYDHYTQRGGTAVDFVREYFGLSYPEAVLTLIDSAEFRVDNKCSDDGYSPQHGRQHSPLSPIHSQFHLPPANGNMRRVYAYLIKQRCISRDIIYHFAHRGLIYEDAQYHNAVFVGTDADGHPRHAHKKSTSLGDSCKCYSKKGPKKGIIIIEKSPTRPPKPLRVVG